MAKYAFLIHSIDTPPIWVDHQLSTSGEIQPIVDSYLLSGVVIDPDEDKIYTMIPPKAITNIRVTLP